MEQIRIATPAGTFDALAAGPRDGREVLLLHGFPQGAIEWEEQLRALADAGYRAVAPDQRGYSAGVRPTDVAGYAFDTLKEDVLRIADALGWKRFDLVGHDWGAVTGWVMADRHADRVRTLTAVSIPHPRPFVEALRTDPDQQRRSAYLRMFAEPGVAEQAMLGNDAEGLRRMLSQAIEPSKVDIYIRRLSEPGVFTAVLNWYRATPPDAVDAAKITVPTLYVWGSADVGVGSVAAHGTQAWVSAPYRFEVFDGISHWVPEQAAPRLSEALLSHLGEHA